MSRRPADRPDEENEQLSLDDLVHELVGTIQIAFDQWVRELPLRPFSTEEDA